MKCKKLVLFSLLFALVWLAFPGVALADVAPPINPPGSNLQPGEDSTQVRMLAEKVVLEIADDGQPQGLGKARVTAEFTMNNLGSAVESMQVRFPISSNNGRNDYPEITNVVVKVNGKIVATSRASYAEPNYFSNPVPWVEFEVTFPPNVDVAITVMYDLQGSGYYPYTAFYYLLETGSGWKDTIGSADIILRLPYAASPLNVVQDFPIGWAETNRGATFSGNEVRWHYEDFEPGPYAVVQNMEFALVAPGAWKKVLMAQADEKASPTDGEAWGRLAKAYKDLFFQGKGYRTDAGGVELFRLSVEAYETCLQLKPSDAQWHAGFADLLVNKAYWDGWSSGPTAEAFRALAEIHTALQLAPNDAKVKEIADIIHGMFPEGMITSAAGYAFPWLTQTPTPLPPTATIAPALNSAEVTGEYTSASLTLWDGQRAQLRLVLQPDYSAELQITSQENNRTQSYAGVWIDNGDGLLRFASAWLNGNAFTFVFNLKRGQLVAQEYPAYFGEGGVSLEKLVPVEPSPTQTAQPSPTLTLVPTSAPEPTLTATAKRGLAATPSPQSSAIPGTPGGAGKSNLPCGAASLAPMVLAGYVWLRKKSRN